MYRFAMVAGLALSFVSAEAEAREFRVGQVPNGEAYGCELCHINANGGGVRTGFGAQVENTLDQPTATADVNWGAIYDQDGDADGYSNGRELGDPEGLWTIGDPDPDAESFNPADRDDSPCGDGIVENPPEECDGEAMIDVTCEDLGWGPGTLSCNSACRINDSECEGWVSPVDQNNETGNNDNPTNNDTTGNSEPGNNEPGNNEPGNNETANNDTDGGGEGTNNQPGPDADDTSDESGCAVIRGGPSPLLALFGLLLFSRISQRRTRRR